MSPPGVVVVEEVAVDVVVLEVVEEVVVVEVVVAVEVVVEPGEAHAFISRTTSLRLTPPPTHWPIKDTTSDKLTVPQGISSPTKSQSPKTVT